MTCALVAEPPADQENEQRLSLVFFNGSKGDMRLKPAMGKFILPIMGLHASDLVSESPLLQREGFILKQGVFMQFKKLIDAGLPVGYSFNFFILSLTNLQVPTNKEWREARES